MYNTRHHLTSNASIHSQRAVQETLAEMMNRPLDYTQEALYQYRETNWGDHAQHMANLSEMLPETTFSLECIGEDGNRWIVFAHNGRSYIRHYQLPKFVIDEYPVCEPGQVHYPVFEPQRRREPATAGRL